MWSWLLGTEIEWPGAVVAVAAALVIAWVVASLADVAPEGLFVQPPRSGGCLQRARGIEIPFPQRVVHVREHAKPERRPTPLSDQ